jgi:XTP/dITP diphosphohydrolase
MRLVLASNNAKKLSELRALFAPLPIELVSQGTLDIEEADEPHDSFVENALAKARHAAAAGDCAAMADDSGLCVDALGGAPGVVSAHYAAIELPALDREGRRRAQDDANNELLLRRLSGETNRRARYVSTLVALRFANDPEPLIASGRWEGEILTSLQGDGGFGYDPLMFIPELNATVAQLSLHAKNSRSHRARAAAQMLTLMREAWHLA